MNRLNRTYIRLTERKGQTMTEYAMVLSVVVMAAFSQYQSFGVSVKGILNTVIGQL
jgi:Flp pilus assembly pilin Flp